MSAPTPTATRTAIRPKSQDGGRATTHRSVVLAIILVCQLMVVLDATIVNVALPDIQSALGFSTAGLSWVLNAYTLSFGGLLLLGARAGDLLGRRRTFWIGIAVFTLASLAGGLATSSGMLLAARAVQGIGGALAAPSALALLTTMFPEGRERLRALGLYTAVSIGGSAVGLVAGGVLVEWASWRWVLFVNVPIGAALVVLARVMLPETPRQSGKFDITGAITSTLGMTALVYGFVHAATAGWGDPLTVGAFGGGVILLAGFVITEIRASAPITPLKLFADRNRSVSYVARLLMVGAMFGMFFYLTQFLQDILGYSALMTGLGFLPLTAALFFASQLSARVLVERFPVRWLISGGVLMSVLGLTWLTQLSASSNYLDILGPLLIFGLGNGIALVPLTSVALSGVAAKDAGAASGLINVMQQVGGSLGLAVLVSVASAGTRHAAAHPKLGTTLAQQHDAAFIVGAQHAFVASVLFLIATLVLVVTVLRDRPRTGAMPVPAMVE